MKLGIKGNPFNRIFPDPYDPEDEPDDQGDTND
jgi:hypothetical protein